jgi:hypothetical protein
MLQRHWEVREVCSRRLRDAGTPVLVSTPMRVNATEFGAVHA